MGTQTLASSLTLPSGALIVNGLTNSNTTDADNIIAGYAQNLTQGFAVRYDGLYATGSNPAVDVRIIPKGGAYVIIPRLNLTDNASNQWVGSLRLTGSDALNTLWQSTLNAQLGITTNGGDISIGAGISRQDIKVLASNGNIGINDTNPVAKLTVGGAVKVGATTGLDGNPDRIIYGGNTSSGSMIALGQNNSNGGFYFGWVYNATPTSGWAEFGTFSNLTPLHLAASVIRLGANNNANTEVLGNAVVVGKLICKDTIVNTTYTAVVGDKIQADTSSAPFTITLPPSPAVGDNVAIEDAKYSWSTNALTIARNSLKINGATSDFTANISGSKLRAVYIDSTYGWSIK